MAAKNKFLGKCPTFANAIDKWALPNMKQRRSISRFFSLFFLLLVVNAVLAPAYAYPAIKLAGCYAQGTQVGEAGPSDSPEADQEVVSETAPFHAVTNAGLHLDIAKASFVPPTAVQIVLVPLTIPIRTGNTLFSSPFLAILFHTAIVPNAP